MFSKACEYGIRAAIYIASKSLIEERATLIDIAEEIDSPTAFTAKILQQLVKSNVVHSIKGPHGGFFIPAEEMKEVKLVQVVVAIDGNKLFTGCGLGLKQCNENHPCPVHFKFKEIRNELQHMLENTTIKEMAKGVETGLAFLRQ
ncbi:Rrf2 family transcriptional regulator [bacterium]|nr:Rrf2 family transcriptional regulator [bacterium]